MPLVRYLSYAFSFLAIMSLGSCSKRNYVYFNDLPDSTIYREYIRNAVEAKIQPGDALAIRVTTLSPEANQLFNSGTMPVSAISGLSSVTNASANAPVLENQGYLVDSEGNIDFPVLGKIRLAGLTRSEARQKIAQGVSQTAQNPIVDLRIVNFKVTVIGEVMRPGVYTVPNGEVNVLEALGMAGDMTPLAVRDNVLIIREKNNHRFAQRINMHNKSMLNDTMFNLQQNDIVYVQPDNKLRNRQANNSSELYRIIPIIISTLSVITLALVRWPK